MKRTLIFTGIGVVLAFTLLFVFNKLSFNSETSKLFTEVKKGDFVISVNVVGELMASSSIDIMGPSFAGRRYIRSRNIKIQDLIPEGTIVNKGDYVGELDRTDLDNTLKDQNERLTTLLTKLDMKKLDTAVVLNSLRNAIQNQRFIIEEDSITLRNSAFEPPTTIRRAEIEFNKSKRVLEQKIRSYKRSVAQSKTDISNQEFIISMVEQRVTDLKELLAGFTITSPAHGMIIYKKEWLGNKRKIGSNINTFDRVIATLPDLSTMLSKTYVNEIDIRKIKEGQKVEIHVDAFPKKSFIGSVTRIANIGEELPNNPDKVFEVQIELKDYDPELRPSMTTGNTIIIKIIKCRCLCPC